MHVQETIHLSEENAKHMYSKQQSEESACHMYSKIQSEESVTICTVNN